MYLAETPLPSSPLPGLDAVRALRRPRRRHPVVGACGSPTTTSARCRACVPGNGARQAFYRDEPNGPTITLPRRYRTKGVVLHELVHWALGLEPGFPHTGARSHARPPRRHHEFCGAERAEELATSYREQRVTSGKPGARRAGRTGALRMGRAPAPRAWRRTLAVFYVLGGVPCRTIGRFDRYERGSSVVPLVDELDGTVVRIATTSIYDVADVPTTF